MGSEGVFGWIKKLDEEMAREFLDFEKTVMMRSVWVSTGRDELRS